MNDKDKYIAIKCVIHHALIALQNYGFDVDEIAKIIKSLFKYLEEIKKNLKPEEILFFEISSLLLDFQIKMKEKK